MFNLIIPEIYFPSYGVSFLPLNLTIQFYGLLPLSFRISISYSESKLLSLMSVYVWLNKFMNHYDLAGSCG